MIRAVCLWSLLLALPGSGGLLWAAPGVETPTGRYGFRTYAADAGLSNQAVTRVAQDRLGFLWVGTQGNLFRFDGRTFRPYGMREGLPSGSITALAADPAGRLWVGTYRGLGYQDGDRFRTFAMPPVPVHELRVRGGRVWVASEAGLWSGTEPDDLAPVPGWSGEARALWAFESPQETWVAGNGSLLRGGTGRPWRPVPLPGERERILDLVGDREGRLLVRTPTRLLRLESGRFVDMTPPVVANPSEDARMSVDAQGRLWVPTNAGLWVLEGGRWRALGSREGLPTVNPTHALLDREGSLWVAGQGLHRLQGLGAWRTHGMAEGLPHPHVWGIVRDAGGTLWVATGGGLARSEGGRWTPVAGTSGLAFRALALRRGGGVWAAGPEGALFQAGPGAALRREPELLPGRQILTLLEDRQGRLWAGTRHGGLQCRPAGARRFEPITLPGGTPTERIGQVVEAVDGTLWVAGEGGLARLTGSTWTRFTQRHGLRFSSLAGLVVARNGELLVRYLEPLGFSRFRVQGEALTDVRHEDASTGLAADMVYALGEDHHGQLWVGTGQGVDLIQPADRQHFGRAQGLPGEDCNANAFLEEADGRIWIGTSTGLGEGLGPWQRNASAPGTVVLGVVASGQAQSMDAGRTFRLPAHPKAVEVQLAVMSFLHEQAVETRYRIQGQDEAWRTTPHGVLSLGNLPPGRHELELESRVQRGPWGPRSTLALKVTYAWWQPWWVRALLGASLITALAQVGRKQWRRLRQRNLELETLLNLADQLTRELESANLALQQESTTDPLTGLRNRRYLDTTIENDLAHVERAYRTFEEQGLHEAPPNADLVFIMVDIDHFKYVNDTFGHLAGDAVLQQFAEILRSATRGSDTIIRWGGEEFLIEARHSQRRDIPIVVERIRRSVEAWRFTLPDGEMIRRTCSIGFAAYPFVADHPLGWKDVVDLADQCLYQAKTTGRNRWVGHVGSSLAEGGPVESLLAHS